MSVAKAKNYYIGLDGCKRMNCAQSVASAFKEKFHLEDNMVDSLKTCGSGNAPAGMCGAYYAAKCAVGKYDKEKADRLERYFKENAGALECCNIRKLKRLSCVGCIEKVSEFLEKLP